MTLPPVADTGQMLSMLINMKELQERKAARQQQDEQFKASLAQAAERLGIDRSDRNFNQVVTYLGVLAQSANKSRDALKGLSATFNWTPEQAQQIAAFANTAPETVAQIEAQAAAQGRADATPMQTAQMNREAAYRATTGGSQGAAAQSGVTTFLASGGDPVSLDQLWSDGFDRYMKRGYISQQAHPMQGAMEQAGVQGGMAARAAGIQYGGDLTAAQKGGLDMQGRNYTLDQIRLAQTAADNQAALAARTGMDRDSVLRTLSEMNATAKEAANDKTSEAARQAALTRYNYLARLLNEPALMIPVSNPDAFKIPGLWDSIIKGFIGPNDDSSLWIKGLNNPTVKP